MKRFLILVVMLIAYTATAQEKNFIDQNYVEVTGVSIIRATPDIAYLSIVIDEGNAASKQGVEVIEKKMFSSLRSLGIDVEKDLSVSDINSSFIKRKDIGQRKEYSLKVNDIKKLGAIYDALQKEGISNINIVKVDIKDKNDLRMKAKQEAVKNAIDKATVLTEAAGRKLGKVIYMVDYDREAAEPTRMMKSLNSASMYGREAVSDTAELDFKDIDITGTVTARFSIIE